MAAAPEVERLGPRLRQERERLGVSLRALARDVGVSASMISQLETGKVQPSVSTLYAITTTLGITVEDLFAPAPASGPDPALDALRGARLGPVVRPAQRRVLHLDSGVTWELLGDLPPNQVDFLRVTYAPGGTSSSRGGLMRHPGTEYGHLLSGTLTLTLGFEELELAPGDSICFDSTTPHGYRNQGTEPAIGIWFVIERPR